ncbi:hypothetical protein [Georgenia sp. AZ-5]|uniref:hypothetical protein n=1 Tax=Georgenia sp. AZ-5 TaxID=3367526 RepID=UPI00375490C2
MSTMSGHTSGEVPWILPTTPPDTAAEAHEPPPGPISTVPPTSLNGGSGPHAPGTMHLPESGDAEDYNDEEFDDLDPARPAPPAPIDWRFLSPRRAEHELRTLDEWVNWLRHEFGIPPTIIPPLWHRHPELLWELSALHTHFLTAHDPDASGSAPIGFLEDFAEARNRLRDLGRVS